METTVVLLSFGALVVEYWWVGGVRGEGGVEREIFCFLSVYFIWIRSTGGRYKNYENRAILERSVDNSNCTVLRPRIALIVTTYTRKAEERCEGAGLLYGR